MEQPKPQPTPRRRISTSDLLSSPAIEELAPSTIIFEPRKKKDHLDVPGSEDREGSESPSLGPVDTLPDDQVKLDGILNYHLSQLDRIQREVKGHNATLEQLHYTLTDMKGQEGKKHTAERLYWRIQGVRNCRNLLAGFVVFHLQEIDRISDLKQSTGGSDIHNM